MLAHLRDPNLHPLKMYRRRGYPDQLCAYVRYHAKRLFVCTEVTTSQQEKIMKRPNAP